MSRSRTKPTPLAAPPTQASQSQERQVRQALASARAHCAARGAQLTDLRAQVLALLLRRDQATKAYELLADMQAHQPGVAPMTVYRALDFLVEQELVHKVDATSSFLVCHHDHSHGHHHHAPVLLVCESCGSTTEWDDADASRQLAPPGFHVHATEIKGECADCAQKVHEKSHPKVAS